MTKKIFILFAAFAIIVIAVCSLTAQPKRIYSALQSVDAPYMMITESDSAKLVSLVDLKGHHVIVNFWQSTDPESRIEANEYDHLVRTSEGRLGLLSVNLDKNKRLFEQIVRRDGLDPTTQRHFDELEAQELIKRYHLESGMKTYLLSPEGKILSINPNKELLYGLINP